MNKRFFLLLALCMALLLSACGSSGGGSSSAAAPQTETTAASRRPDYSGMTLEQICALDEVDTISLLNYLADRPELPMEEIVALGILDNDDLSILVTERFPGMTMEEVRALAVFSEEELRDLEWAREEAIRENGGADPALPMADRETGVTIGLTKGDVSRETGYAVPSGEELLSPSDGYMELDLGNGNYILLLQNTKAVLNRFGDELRVELSYGWLSYYLGAPEKLDCTLVCVDSMCTADMESRAGYISHERGALFMKVAPYLGSMTLHLKDGSSAVVRDGVLTMVRKENEVTEESEFSGKFNGMTNLILNHREIADELAGAYDMTLGAVLLTVGIRIEPEIRIQDMEDGTYRRTVIDVNGDVTEFGVFNASDDSMRSNTVYTYDEDHRVVREVESLPGQSWDGRDTTWTYYETGEAKTRNYIMPDGRFHNEEFDRKGNQIFMEEGINGTAEVRVETEFNEDGVRVHEVSTGSDYIAERFYDAKGRTERAIRTDLQGNYIQVITYTYHPNGQVATQRTEDYQINHKWYESTYDEAGNEIKTESGSL